MKNFHFLLLAFLPLFSFVRSGKIQITQSEESNAFALLNEIRLNPEKYAKSLRIYKLDSITRKKLIWNDTLARVAKIKANDMANRNYFSHVNPEGVGINYQINESGYLIRSQWLANKAANYFEALTVGSNDGPDAIKTLIIDADDPIQGHQRHLLGIGRWNASLVDVGIGFALNSGKGRYSSYACVIIAKHN